MPTTFAETLPVKQVKSHEYSVNLDDVWCIGTVPNGGYVTSAFMVVARTHMQKTHAGRKAHDVINLHLEFLRRTSAGPATFKVKDVKIGARISNLHLTLCQHREPSDPSSPVEDEVQGYVTISSIAQETGPTEDTSYKLLPPALPASHKNLLSNTDVNYIKRRDDPYGKFRRATHNMHMWLPRTSKAKEHGFPPSTVDQWIRFTPMQSSDRDGRWTNDTLGIVVDMFPQIFERYKNEDLESALLTTSDEMSDHDIKKVADSKRPANGGQAPYWYPTLLLNLDVKKRLPEAGVEWLFIRIQAKKIFNGRFDLNVEVWDDPEKGDLVALSTHACLVVDASRNMVRNNNKKAQAKDSKI